MSTLRLGSQYVVSEYALTTKTPPRKVLLDVLDDMLWELERKAGTGEEICWETLHLTVNPEREPASGLRLRADVEMRRDDVVAGLAAVALARHEQEKP